MGIKFVVDLSPPIEGEEAVETVERLWCPDEVLDWRSNITGNYIEEDQSPPQSPQPDKKLNEPGAPDELPPHIKNKMENDLDAFRECLLGKTKGKTTQHEEKVETPKVKEKRPAYSLTRHIGAIERVLHIIHGLDPQISTTPTWYTVHKVALQMECTVAVQDYLLSWLYQNQNFIERYPGFVLRTAAEMKNAGLFRDAFAILVGKQLVGGNMECAGVFNIDERIPPEAEQWSGSIMAAKTSLQGRLERLYSYIDSTAWLHNAQIIPEYQKIVVHLTGSSRRLRAAALRVDSAIRSELKDRLAALFAFSEDPGDPNWMNPWEKAMFDMMPGRKQIFSRMYWKQLHKFSPNQLITPEIIIALVEWNGILQMETAKEEGLAAEEPQGTDSRGASSEVETAICLLSLGREAEGTVERTEATVTSSEPANPISRWQNFGTRDSQNAESSSSQPSIFSPKKNDGAIKEPPRSFIMNSDPTGPRYGYELPTTSRLDGPPPYGLLAPEVGKVGEKRKTRSSSMLGHSRKIGPQLDESELLIGSSTSFRSTGLNLRRKRRCSVERDIGEYQDEDEDISEASFFRQGDTEAGELEMFNISGVYPDPRLSSSPPPTTSKGKEKSITEQKNNLTLRECDMDEFDDISKAVEDEFNPRSYSNPTFSKTPYWPFSQNQTGPSDGLTTALDAPPAWYRSATWVDPKTGFIVARHVDNHPKQTSTNTSTAEPLAPMPLIHSTVDPIQDLYDWNVPTSVINVHQLKWEIETYLNQAGSTQLNIPISFEPFWAGDGQLIVSLEEEEWAFCPAWAGGVDTSGITASAFNTSTRAEGRMVELEVRGGPSSGLPKGVGRDREGSEKEEDYDDCATETGSIGSFSTSGFSSFGVMSDFDGESDCGTVAGDNTPLEMETESLLGSDMEDQSSTEAGDSSDSDDGFEEVAWEDGF